ncbi:MAG TPA: hypothetical protein VK972_04955, partial [Wenzhouxiangella sp.]|nr:hypothetical protein [Wenzhouxiangella sp.]
MDDAPAYRGTAYIVFERLQLKQFGNRIPNITVELVGIGTPPIYADIGAANPAIHTQLTFGGANNYSPGALRVYWQEDGVLYWSHASHVF